MKGTAEKSSPSKRVSSWRVKKSDSQTSLGSTGSLEDSSGVPSSPSSTGSSRGSPDRTSSAVVKSASSRTGPTRTGSRENVRRDSKETPQVTGKKGASGIPTKNPKKTTKNGEEKSGKK